QKASASHQPIIAESELPYLCIPCGHNGAQAETSCHAAEAIAPAANRTLTYDYTCRIQGCFF
ncbi:hypothetical protein KCU84_g24158, partial [Aureobasidium melanogenum]